MSRTSRALPLVFAITCIAAGPQLAAQGLVETDTVASHALGRRVEYHVVLPVHYDPARRYPVLWLLHGYGGGDDDWLRLTPLTHDVARYPMIVVLPGVGNSWYVNAAGRDSARYEDFIIHDLYQDVLRRFSVDTTRQAIAGLSMGGYGAVMLAMRHPSRYRFAGGLSAALTVPADPDPVTLHVAGPSVDSAFRDMPAATRAGYDPFVLFRRTPAAALPFFYLAVGTHDGFTAFLPKNRALTDSLRAYGVPYEYRERPGTHSWAFWGSELPLMLPSMWRALSPSHH